MTPTFKKLNYKDQPEICILHAPEEFGAEVEAMRSVAKVCTDVTDGQEISFVLVFVKGPADVARAVEAVVPKLMGDGLMWFAFPKGTSRKYKGEISRDKGWEVMGEAGFEPVRSVAIDEDWSALRFRRVEYIKTLTRRQEMALTQKGKERIAGDS